MRSGVMWLLGAGLGLAPMQAGAGTIVVNNGLAPPTASNVINATNSLPTDQLAVLNVGCVFLVFCDSPGASTSVLLTEGGVIGGGVAVRHTSSFVMTGGTVPRDADGIPGGPQSVLGAGEFATITVQGGEVGALVIFGPAVGTVEGGSIGSADVTGFLQLRGGSLERILVYGGGVVTVYGSSFSLDGSPIGLGELAAGSGRLTGTLASGDTVAIDFERSVFGDPPSGSIVLVPEPTSASLLCIGLAGLGLSRRRDAVFSGVRDF